MYKEVLQELVRPERFQRKRVGRDAKLNCEANDDVSGVGSAHSSYEIEVFFF